MRSTDCWRKSDDRGWIPIADGSKYSPGTFVLIDKTEVARIEGVAAIVPEKKPLAGGNFDGPEIVLIPILFIDAENAIAAQAWRQQVLLTGQLMLPNIVIRQREINGLGIGGYRIREPGVVPDDVAVAAIHLEDMHRIEIFICIDAVDIEDPLPDLEHVTRQAAEAMDEPGGTAVGWWRTEADEAKSSRFPEAGGENQASAWPGRA